MFTHCSREHSLFFPFMYVSRFLCTSTSVSDLITLVFGSSRTSVVFDLLRSFLGRELGSQSRGRV